MSAENRSLKLQIEELKNRCDQLETNLKTETEKSRIRDIRTKVEDTGSVLVSLNVETVSRMVGGYRKLIEEMENDKSLYLEMQELEKRCEKIRTEAEERGDELGELRANEIRNIHTLLIGYRESMDRFSAKEVREVTERQRGLIEALE